MCEKEKKCCQRPHAPLLPYDPCTHRYRYILLLYVYKFNIAQKLNTKALNLFSAVPDYMVQRQ